MLTSIRRLISTQFKPNTARKPRREALRNAWDEVQAKRLPERIQ
jgi:hypothetical protein